MKHTIWERALAALAILLFLAAAMGADTNISSPAPTQDASTGATGSAVPAKATYLAGNGSGNLTGLLACDKSAFINFTTATTTQIVALVSGQSIRVCGFLVSFVGSATANTFIFKSGTGSNCGTGTASISPTLQGPTATGPGLVAPMGGGLGLLFNAGSANALCGTTSAATNVGVWVFYTQF
jgi:hypothetical protein